jgi:hypothetical protein
MYASAVEEPPRAASEPGGANEDDVRDDLTDSGEDLEVMESRPARHRAFSVSSPSRRVAPWTAASIHGVEPDDELTIAEGLSLAEDAAPGRLAS